MDSRALERLGHHVVSRRVALGFRNRTDLAASLQFTVRTLADIEHGVRKASPGTYAMLENKLAWAPGSIDTILSGGEPNELVPTLHRNQPLTPGIRTAPDHPQRSVAGVHRGIAAGVAAAHRRPAQQTPRHLGRLGRRTRPTRRMARTGLTAPRSQGMPNSRVPEPPTRRDPEGCRTASQGLYAECGHFKRDRVAEGATLGWLVLQRGRPTMKENRMAIEVATQVR